MARAKTQADSVYNARRRYKRQAERYAKKAEKTSGATKLRYQAQAKLNADKAIATYQKGSKPNAKLKAMADAFGRGLTTSGSSATTGKLVEKSVEALVSTKLNQREQMSREILSIDNVGSMFYGGLVDIWGKDEESRKHPNQAILSYFGAKDIMEVIEMLEDEGIDIYSPVENDSVYRSIQLDIQTFVLTHRNEK